MHLAEINLFPVKSMAATQPAMAMVEPWGLAGDRRWLVVDPAGRFITQRDVARMACIEARLVPGGLALWAPNRPAVTIKAPDAGAETICVSIWGDRVLAAKADAAADAWVHAALGIEGHLVFLPDMAARPLKAEYSDTGGSLSFADALPLLLTSLDSLADLNTRMAVPVPISRFRGNIVIAGAEAWAEDGWRRIGIGAQATFRVVTPCERCVMTTIDQATGERPDKSEPLRTLGRFRRDARGVMFGVNMMAEQLGRIAVGDRIRVLERGASNVRLMVEK